MILDATGAVLDTFPSHASLLAHDWRPLDQKPVNDSKKYVMDAILLLKGLRAVPNLKELSGYRRPGPLDALHSH